VKLSLHLNHGGFMVFKAIIALAILSSLTAFAANKNAPSKIFQAKENSRDVASDKDYLTKEEVRIVREMIKERKEDEEADKNDKDN
jgi:hypothetical protein